MHFVLWLTMKMSNWEKLFENKLTEHSTTADSAHDILHLQRVVNNARALCESENGNWNIVMPAAWLHDFVTMQKDNPQRKEASRLSAIEAVKFLNECGYPPEFYDAISHAIEAHSFSANIVPQTLEAKIVQDSDRLDGLGAIGIARCFATGGALGRPFYNAVDPFCKMRAPNDEIFTVDHFYKKLFRIAETLQTASAREEGRLRVALMKSFLSGFERELA